MSDARRLTLLPREGGGIAATLQDGALFVPETLTPLALGDWR